WGLIGAAMLITSVPTIIIFLIGNEQIEKALTLDGGMK
ncbi:MAG: carbohydrate ABC transporter permease, partial [Vallitaleaceae bacterium]|nr:carbohydrate ABC transporter permease [Vallitaleaceae bacterium]